MEWRRKRIVSTIISSFFVHHVRKSRGNSLILYAILFFCHLSSKILFKIGDWFLG